MGNLMSQREDCDETGTATPAAPGASDGNNAKGEGLAGALKVEQAGPHAPKAAPSLVDAVLSAAKSASGPIIDAESIPPGNAGPKARSRANYSERPAPPASERVITLFAGAQKSEPPAARTGKIALLAASVALAAAFGAFAAGLARHSSAEPDPAIAALANIDINALQADIAHMRTELAALRTSVESVTRTTNTQLTKLGERLEKAQAEPAAKLAKAVEAIERLKAESAKEATGTVPAGQPAATAVATGPARASTAGQPPQPSTPPIVQGWVLQEVYRGVAVIQGGRFRVMEVEAGDTVPGLGRIEAIRKQDGRWVVVTPKGLIVAAR
jgi:hypothetical protein